MQTFTTRARHQLICWGLCLLVIVTATAFLWIRGSIGHGNRTARSTAKLNRVDALLLKMAELSSEEYGKYVDDLVRNPSDEEVDRLLQNADNATVVDKTISVRTGPKITFEPVCHLRIGTFGDLCRLILYGASGRFDGCPFSGVSDQERAKSVAFYRSLPRNSFHSWASREAHLNRTGARGKASPTDSRSAP